MSAVPAFGDDIATAVDLPTAAERKKAALKLAKQYTVTDLLPRMREFGAFRQREPEVHTFSVKLRVGRRDEKTDLHVYTPRGYSPKQRWPMLMAFHGTGQSGRIALMEWIVIAQNNGLVLVAPSESGANTGYRFSERERAAALAAIRYCRRAWNIDENRIFVAGSSRGAHLAWDLALRHPGRYAGLVAAIGCPRINTAKGQNNMRYLENVAMLPIRDLQGSRDNPWMVSNLRFAFKRLESFGAKDAEFIEFPNRGHGYDLRKVEGDLFRKTRVPVPQRVVRAYARRGEGRAHWIEVLSADATVKEQFRIVAKASRVKGVDDETYKRFLQEEADKRTARLEVSSDGENRFVAKGLRVRRFRLLLTREMFNPERPVEVVFNGKTFRRKVVPDAGVLAQEFVERFDRTFLPVAEVRVP